MRCLHLCNDFVGSKVYKNLYHALSQSGEIQQTVFTPIRENAQKEQAELLADKLNIKSIPFVKIHSAHRLFFRLKIYKLYKHLHTYLLKNNFDIVNATTLYSDGALALKIYEEFQVPYLVTIRGTDVNLFLKYRPDLNPLLKKILTHAKHIIFISEAHRKIFYRETKKLHLYHVIHKKTIVIPNGIDTFWLENITHKKALKKDRFNILYIGKLNANKNVIKLINAVKKLHHRLPFIKLNIIGSGGDQQQKILEKSKDLDFVNYHGPIFEIHELRQHFMQNDLFAMVSKSETFGLVYVEALSQGLPVIFSKDQGIDGTFSSHIGYPAVPTSVDSISQALESAYDNYEHFELENINFERFQWLNIGQHYLELFRSTTP